MTIEIVMNRQKVADTVHKVMEHGLELLGKAKFEPTDFAKMKVMKSMGTAINASVTMVQQETAQQRIELIRDRMKQLGYSSEQPMEIEAGNN